MNIAIIDDETVELEAFETVLRFCIKKFWAEYESLINIETFYSVNLFRNFFHPEFYQIVILGGNMKAFTNFIAFNSNHDVKIFFINDCCEAEL